MMAVQDPKVGDMVEVKYDIEQTAEVVSVDRVSRSLEVRCTDGGYVHGGCREYDEEGECYCGAYTIVRFRFNEVWPTGKGS
jgi:hypothetical protein